MANELFHINVVSSNENEKDNKHAQKLVEFLLALNNQANLSQYRVCLIQQKALLSNDALPDLVVFPSYVANYNDPTKIIETLTDRYKRRNIIYAPLFFLYTHDYFKDSSDSGEKLQSFLRVLEKKDIRSYVLPSYSKASLASLYSNKLTIILNNILYLKRALETSLQGEQLINVLLDAIEGKEKNQEQQVGHQELNKSVENLLKSSPDGQQWYIHKVKDTAGTHQILLCSRDKMAMENSRQLRTDEIQMHLLNGDWTFIESDSKKNTKIFKLLY